MGIKDMVKCKVLYLHITLSWAILRCKFPLKSLLAILHCKETGQYIQGISHNSYNFYNHDGKVTMIVCVGSVILAKVVEDITCPRVDMNFIFEWSTRYLRSECTARTSEISS